MMLQLDLGERLYKNQLTRRDFVQLAAVATTAPLVSNCAVNPVTGDNQIMLMSEAQEINIDKSQSPFQFSNDYGVHQDQQLNQYLNNVGAELAKTSHRPQMPYSFQAVNANYVNAYAFPGGTIATTRGILTRLNNEAELAALLGHELGHVNARHTASRMSKSQLINIAMMGSTIALKDSPYGGLAGMLGAVGGKALLASYSRGDERQADALGMEYMVKNNYSPEGMVGLMGVLRDLNKHKPSAMQVMFSTHPMSDERFATAKQRADALGPKAKLMPRNRERYMDSTARLRKIAPAIVAMENAERLMGQKKLPEAGRAIAAFTKMAPNDYAGLVIRGKYQYLQQRFKDARPLFEKAARVYPQEAQAHHLLGLTHLAQRQPSNALRQFQTYEKVLPGNPTTLFLQGISYENMQQTKAAANLYARYLQQIKQGAQAKHAYERLIKWGYLQPTTQQRS